MGESKDHSNINEIMKIKLKEWFGGITVKEYVTTGRRVDILNFQYSGIQIIVEITWYTGQVHFLKDLDILQMSNALIKIFIVNPIILTKPQLLSYYDKIRISEIMRGYLVSQPLDGAKILKQDKKYLKNVHEIITTLINFIPPKKEVIDRHFKHIIENVLDPILDFIDRDRLIDFNYINSNKLLDQGLLNDLLVNHYPEVKELLMKLDNITIAINALLANMNKENSIFIEELCTKFNIPIIEQQYFLYNTDLGPLPLQSAEKGLPRKEFLEYLLEPDLNEINNIDYSTDGILISHKHRDLKVLLENPQKVELLQFKKSLRDKVLKIENDITNLRSLKEKYIQKKDELILLLKRIKFKSDLKFKSNICDYLKP